MPKTRASPSQKQGQKPGQKAARTAQANLAELEALTGYRWQRPALLLEALTHPSAGKPDYQRLEFLGDRVLGLLVANLLLEVFPTATEGELGRRHAALVREETLALVARRLGLGRLIRLGAGERVSGGGDKAAILADTLEAVLGAMYHDGGFAAAKRFIETNWQDLLPLMEGRDAKTRLQEELQRRRLALPHYTVLNESGPDHEKYFRVRVSSGLGSADGEGKSKRIAEMLAAQALLETFDEVIIEVPV